MAFLSSLDISGSGMTAQRLRMDIIAQNVANAHTTRTESGTAYRRQMVVFAENQSFKNVLNQKRLNYSQRLNYKGVQVMEVVEDQTPLTPVYDPTHPDSDEMGYVYMPNVDLTVENLDSIAATRAWEANKSVFDAVKSMASKALTIGK